MKIININDIEDLILAKHEIDLYRIDIGEINEKTQLNEFIQNYAAPEYIYLIGNRQIPFNYIKLGKNDYLFITSNKEDDINIILNKLKLLKYNTDNLCEISNADMLSLDSFDNVIAHGNKYYM